MAHIPDPWTFALLALAAYRLYRVGARDTITEPIRAVVSYPDATSVSLNDDPEDEGLTVIATENLLGGGGKGWRVYASTLIRCPWCAGFYVSVAVWGLWLWQPHWATVLAVPWALSATVGLVTKNLDA